MAGLGMGGGISFTLPYQLATFTKADVTVATAWTTGNSPVTLFTVSGTVLMTAFGVVSTSMTSTGATGTLALGVAGNTGVIIAATTVNGTILNVANQVWASTAGVAPGYSLPNTGGWFAVAGNIILTVATNSMSAGGMTLYCPWIPLSAGASVVGN